MTSSTSTPTPNQTTGRYCPATLHPNDPRTHFTLRYSPREPQTINPSTTITADEADKLHKTTTTPKGTKP